MARPKMDIDEDEIKEIIKLKLDEIDGRKNKLTYNNVWTLNKKIANNPAYLRDNGKPFKLYGYQCWANEYDGQPCYGRKLIDEMKVPPEFILAGENFITTMHELVLIINNHHKKPEVLKKRILKAFESDKREIALLRQQNTQLKEELKSTRDSLALFEKGFATLFCSSSFQSNSLQDVISLKKAEDSAVYNELKTMFNDDCNKITEIVGKPSTQKNNPNVVDINLFAEKRQQELKDEGF